MADVEGVPKHVGETSSSTSASTSAIPKSAKGCGLWWCFKSAFDKSLRRSRRENSSGRLDQPVGQASGSGIPLQPPRLLGDTEWLGDEHITADYTLLEQELLSDNPDLAARTRFLRPAQAHLLRLTEDDHIRQDALWGIIKDENENDAANFLFLPVNDGGASAQGTHWSLLLVDRRDPEAVVAYHFDSLRGYNSAKAEQLAARLGASLQPAQMAQQRNRHDCGVFVLDATRTLVVRMAQTQRIDDELLDLDNLVAGRQALRDRLSAHAPL
ncbi:Ulp1 family isopeptidase [Bradyrhizobium macuxiense]|nr:Ulp1 family isopeptidase [Bradyrhizobium macuxiense]